MRKDGERGTCGWKMRFGGRHCVLVTRRVSLEVALASFSRVMDNPTRQRGGERTPGFPRSRFRFPGERNYKTRQRGGERIPVFACLGGGLPVTTKRVCRL